MTLLGIWPRNRGLEGLAGSSWSVHMASQASVPSPGGPTPPQLAALPLGTDSLLVCTSFFEDFEQ